MSEANLPPINFLQMRIINPKFLNVETLRKTKIETTYEYVPILGQILGSWRKVTDYRMGDTVELHIQTPLEEYDQLFINGKEITIPRDEKAD